MNKEILIRNKERGRNPILPHEHEGYQPEHERLRRTPDYADPNAARLGKQQIAEDFQHAKKHPLVIGSSKGKKAEQERLKAEEQQGQPPPQFRRHMAIASGHSEELSWVPQGHRTDPDEYSSVPRNIENYSSNPNKYSIKFDDVPSPPPDVRFHVEGYTEPEPEPEPGPDPDPYGHLPLQRHGNPPRVSIDDVVEGNYFVVVTDTIVGESPVLDDIEAFVERILYNSTNGVQLDDIIVLRKMKVKVGVGVS